MDQNINKPGRKKTVFNLEEVKQKYAACNYQYYTLAQQLNVNKDTLLQFLKENGLYKPKPKTQPAFLGSTQNSMSNSTNNTTLMRQLADADEYALKYKRWFEEEERKRKKVEEDLDKALRKLDAFEDRKQIELEQLRSSINAEKNSGLAGLANTINDPDKVKSLAESFATVYTAIKANSGGGSNTQIPVNNGKHAQAIAAITEVFNKLDDESALYLLTINQAYGDPTNKTYLTDLYNKTIAAINGNAKA
ncbi:MAG: hypothetical protein V4538_01770 [Bacteroidota bacterium]